MMDDEMTTREYENTNGDKQIIDIITYSSRLTWRARARGWVDEGTSVTIGAFQMVRIFKRFRG